MDADYKTVLDKRIMKYIDLYGSYIGITFKS